ncbi:Dihydrofolate reductase incomplete domain containing protein [Pandoravirus salinus]|uniref:Dihydrofolate reductase incomplete domain containing protein n=1 Tax=Pandoravirus salinus TaxID=1349410 RepID=S4VY84_9VIRU|nr:Dihydrofolate reductase incomplete domain [Pandoravirus salinus]AGO85644.1 Dihydrofolate reductase incomplete domain containing protein [Pandoravirus salinus]
MENVQTTTGENGDDGAGHRAPPAVHIVVCTDSDDVIAIDGVLPWAFRAAGQRAAIDALVKDAPIVIGARSTSVFGGAPPGARTIVLSRSGALPIGAWARAYVVQSPEAALAMCAGESVLYVLGGVSTFAAFMPYAAVVHRVVVTRRGGWLRHQGTDVVSFPWLGRAGARITSCGPLVPGRGGCSHQVRSDTLAPVDRVPSPSPPVDSFVDDLDLEQAKMISFYEHALRTTALVGSSSDRHAAATLGVTESIPDTPVAAGPLGGHDTAMMGDVDGDDVDDDEETDGVVENWYPSDSDSDGMVATTDDASTDDGEEDADSDDGWSDSHDSPVLSARRARARTDRKRPPHGCMITLLGRCAIALAAAVVNRLGQDDLLSLWRASAATRGVLVDVLTAGPTSPCGDIVDIVAGGLGQDPPQSTATRVCPQDEAPSKRTGAAWLWLDVLPRLRRKCALAEHTLSCPHAASPSSALVDYAPGTIERVMLWAAATRCGAAINACLALADSMAAAAAAYNRSDGFTKRAASVGPVSAWLASAMGADDGAAADLATTDVWLPAIALARSAGRLGSPLLLAVAQHIAATNLATGRGFANGGRRLDDPPDPSARASLASARLVSALVEGLGQTRGPSDPPRRIDADAGDDTRDDNAQAVRLVEHISEDGTVDSIVRDVCAARGSTTANAVLVATCRRLCRMAARDASPVARAAGTLLARILAVASSVDHADGWHPQSCTMRLWSIIAPTMAVANTESFWTALNAAGPSTSLPGGDPKHQGSNATEPASVSPPLTDRDDGMAASFGVGGITPVNLGDEDAHHARAHAATDNTLGLTGLFEHEIDLCVAVAVHLPPWDLISLATASRATFKSVWAAVCRASLDAADGRLAGTACGASVYIGSGSSVLMRPAPDVGFTHALGALMLTCHRMPRMEMMADDAEALISPALRADDARERLDALERDPNLPKMLADTVACAARLGCGAVIVRCLEVARRMGEVVRHSGRARAQNRGFGSWLDRQMGAARRTTPEVTAGGACLPVAALAHAAGRERSLALLSIACCQVSMAPAAATIATTFWGAGGRRVVLADSNTESAASHTDRLAVVIVACLAGMWDRRLDVAEQRRAVDIEADEAFLHGMEPTVDFLVTSNSAEAGASTPVTQEPDRVLRVLRQFGASYHAPRGTRTESLCLTARFLVAPPGQLVAPDSMRAYIANLLVRAAACANRPTT